MRKTLLAADKLNYYEANLTPRRDARAEIRGALQ